MFETNSIFITDETGKEKEMEILFTFEDGERKKKYVLFIDPQDDSGEVFASAYDEEGNLYQVTDQEEWAMIEEVLGAFAEDDAE
ncbi:MAG: DUF1292 domain-containing protein [Erysipelotrichaceae bacterium]